MNFNWPLAGALVVSLGACAWLYQKNSSLQSELATARSDVDSRPVRAAAAPVPEVTMGSEKTRTASAALQPVPASAGGFGQSSSDRPTAVKEEVKETRAARRVRRQAEVMALFGRLDGETEEEYRERMVPFVTMALDGPRTRLEDARKAAEEIAGVTEDQRTQLDKVFSDSFEEVLALTNRAVEGGELTPYERNWVGVMNVAGGMGAILGGTESQITQILSQNQRQMIYDQGFEWGEYLGVTVPWEELKPPPPPAPDSQ